MPFVGYGDPQFTGSHTASVAESPVFTTRDAGKPIADVSVLNSSFKRLPGTRKELLAMASLLGAPSDAVKLGPEATEKAVKNDPNLSKARVIEFATHGLLPRGVQTIDEPGLVFTPPAKPTAEDDGVLTASEAAALDLNADWVLLSACNTDAADGSNSDENLSGLARAFLFAGARSLLVSHWSVNDDATALLTVETLKAQRAQPNLSRAQAFQQAMRAVRTGKRADGSNVEGWTPTMADPSAWAAFSLIAANDN